MWLPAFSYAGSDGGEGGGFLGEMLAQQSPLLAYELEGGKETDGLQTESGSLREKILLQEGLSEDEESETGDTLEMPKTEAGKLRLDEETQRRLQEENQTGSADGEDTEGKTGQDGGSENAAGSARQEDAFGFVRAQVRSQEYDWSYYQDFDALIKGFYAVDATTEASPDQIQLDQLLGKDLTLEKNPDVPQILIYHTHSQEAFADSVPGDASTSIVGAGELLAQFVVGHAEPVGIVMLRKISAVHEDIHQHRHQKHHHRRETVPPRSENTRHLLFVRSPAGVGGVVADPAGSIQNGTGQRHHQCEDVEVPQLRHIVRIHEALFRNAVPQNGGNVDIPREFQQDETDDHHDESFA